MRRGEVQSEMDDAFDGVEVHIPDGPRRSETECLGEQGFKHGEVRSAGFRWVSTRPTLMTESRRTAFRCNQEPQIPSDSCFKNSPQDQNTRRVGCEGFELPVIDFSGIFLSATALGLLGIFWSGRPVAAAVSVGVEHQRKDSGDPGSALDFTTCLIFVSCHPYPHSRRLRCRAVGSLSWQPAIRAGLRDIH